MSTEYLYHTVDAAHIRNIGEQSVSNKIQAVLEIVKNAYDADATLCTVTLIGEMGRHRKVKIEKIIIEDNGVGMTRKDLTTKFMRVGTRSKVRVKLSPKLKRRVSGEKGMGHYSIQRLGERAVIVTTPERYQGREFSASDDKSLILELDWAQYKEGKEFGSIGNKLQKKQKGKIGTMIEISKLRDKWNADGKENDLTLLSKNLGSLLLPKELQEEANQQFTIKIKTEGFDVDIPKIESMLLLISPFKITAKLRGDKINYRVFEYVNKLKKHREIQSDGKLTAKEVKCGDADLVIHWFPGIVSNWAPGFMKVDALRRQLQENSGIKIYNDQIRVMPYGEKGNDWVRLDTRKSGPAAGGMVRNVHLIGFLKLTREKNPEIIETTTRQAVKENNAFRTLRDNFVLRVIAELEANRKIVSKEKQKKEYANKALVSIKEMQEKIEELPIEKYRKSEYANALSEIANDVTHSKKQWQELEDKLTSNIEMYRNLSTVGIQTLAFNHEIINPIRFVNGTLQNVLNMNKNKPIAEIKQELESSLNQIQNALNWANFVKEFSGLLSGGEKATKKTSIINLEKMISDLKIGFLSIFETLDIKMKDPIFRGSKPKIKMNRAALESILVNLISNSIRALKRVDRKRYMQMEIYKTDSNIVIEFVDNGYGISDENKKRIFRPFFTTYTDDEDRGTGMGLTIIKEIVEDNYHGKVMLKKTIYEEDESGKGMTRFLISIPKKEVSP